MSRKLIPVEEVAKEWFKDPEFVAEYQAKEEEFALAAALIRARGAADMTQEQVAQAMGTTQTAIARLESGRDHAVDAHVAAICEGYRVALAHQL